MARYIILNMTKEKLLSLKPSKKHSKHGDAKYDTTEHKLQERFKAAS